MLGFDGHVDGELLVVGPFASLRADHFLQATASEALITDPQHVSTKDWDVEDRTPNPLQSLIVLSSRLAMSTVLSLPITLTHLALINLDKPISLHRLPAQCPLLVVLDLSFNTWLAHMSIETVKNIERIDWERWAQLRILGWRDCTIPDGMLTNLNRRRWDDIELMLV